jgi:hypothetical protein
VWSWDLDGATRNWQVEQVDPNVTVTAVQVLLGPLGTRIIDPMLSPCPPPAGRAGDLGPRVLATPILIPFLYSIV